MLVHIWPNISYKYLPYAAHFVIECDCYQDEYSVIWLEE